MNKVATIVVPVDFSEITPKLVEYATFMAGRLNATLHFVHVVSLYYGDSMFGMPFADELRLNYETESQKRMENLLEDSKEANPGCSGEILSGDPVDEIVRVARDRDADMLIISTHGAKGLEKILLGSVTERVVKRVHCPILVMNPYKKQ